MIHPTQLPKSSSLIYPKRFHLLILLFIAHLIVSAQFFIMDSVIDKLVSLETTETFKNFQWRIEAAYFLGYMILPMLLAIYLIYKGKCKQMITSGLFISSTATILSPTFFESELSSIIFIRAIVGFGHALVFISTFMMIYNWFPKQEYIRVTTMVTMGFQAGMVMANFLRRSIDTYEYTSFFNYTGTISLAFTAIFYFFSYNHPSLHSSISPSEVTHLRNSGAPYSFPPIGVGILKEIKESNGLINFIITHLCFQFVNLAFLAISPYFVIEMYTADMTYMGLKYMVLIAITISIIIDFLINNLSMKNVKEGVAIVGMISTGILLRSYCTIDHFSIVRTSAYVLAYSFFLASFCTHTSSLLEIAPRISPLVISFCLTVLSILGIVAFNGSRFLLDNSGAWGLIYHFMSFALFIGAISWSLHVYFEHKRLSPSSQTLPPPKKSLEH